MASSSSSSSGSSSRGIKVFGTLDQDLKEKVSEDTICVALGKDEEEGKSILLWAFHNSGGRRICILHVHPPPKLIRNPLGPAKTPAKYVNERLVTEHEEKDRQNMHEILNKYGQICGKMGVQAVIRQTEMENIGEGIVTLITQNGIKRLVMGAAAEKHYYRKMIDLKSEKAKYVCERAPVDCFIQFICKGCLIHTRKPSIDHIDQNGESSLMVSRSRSVPSGNNSNEAEAGCSNLYLRSQSVAQNHIWEDRNIVKSAFNAMFRGGTKEPSSPKSRSEAEHNSTSDHESDVLSLRSPSGSSRSTYSPKGVLDITLSPLVQKPSTPTLEGFEFMSPFSPGNSSVMYVASSNGAQSVADKSTLDNPHYERLQQMMADAEKLTLLQQKVARELGEALSKAQEELILRREIEEGKAKEREIETMKNQIDQLMEKFQIFQEHETALKNQIVELQMERDNAVKEVKELRYKQGECSGWNMPRFSEFSLLEIKEATQNFNESRKIGDGGYGNVYKGYLRQIEVAIKRLHPQSLHSSCGQGPSEFQMEVRVLSQLSHPNLVRLVGSCPEVFALIYEHLPNGSLEDRLKCRDKSPPLLWKTRIRIAAELCSVLVYLHSRKPHSIIHGDLKPSNILLDANFVSKLSDFGICRVLCHDQCPSNNTTLCRITVPKGTLGYVDPEFLETGKITMKVDVYSFGVILLQLLTNRSASISIANDVKSALGVGNLNALLDPSAGDWPIVVAQTLAELALGCCDRNRKNRPELGSDVWEVLESIMASSVASTSTQMDRKG